MTHKASRAAQAAVSQNANRFVTARVLRATARAMLPFYRTVASSRTYANRWSRAVVSLDVTLMDRLFRLASPRARKPLVGTDGRGYIVNFEFKGPVNLYGSGTENTSPGARFVFEPRVHQAIACAVVPPYRTLAVNSAFARALALAIRRGESRIVELMVRSLVTVPQLKRVTIEESGIALAFRYSFSKYEYEHFLFHEQFE